MRKAPYKKYHNQREAEVDTHIYMTKKTTGRLKSNNKKGGGG